MSPEQLADALWGESAPDSWRKVVQTVVMRLRKILGADAIETSSAGYRLKVAPGDVDAWAFADLVDHARALAAVGELDRAVYALDDALAQWHGEPLQDLERWPARRGRGRSARGAPSARRGAAARGARGPRHATTRRSRPRPRWRSPSRCANGAGSCSRSRSTGRDARARRCGRCRVPRLTLREELGIEPRAELVALEQAILDQDPALAAAPDARVARSERCPYKGLESYDVDDAESFFGRDLDVAACRQRLAEAGALVVTGGSGSGKSSLVRAGLVPLLRAEGARRS